MFDEDDFIDEEELKELFKTQDYVYSNPELVGTNLQLEELVNINLKAVKMDDEKEYPPKLILAAFLVKVGGTIGIEPLEMLLSLKKQIDEWRTSE